ncbi:hypothetical protein [Evansella tamaricis]|uniref:Uncharacterized protein n=1 Tax=Evansella tamaricis TaxID=2069301 RepID=A0ABS6JGR6_9BACI|nr:hypothetical protein [Evansella tamaricis]MBU9711518.1 hypothetical protein [Evansella tamaricis]
MKGLLLYLSMIIILFGCSASLEMKKSFVDKRADEFVVSEEENKVDFNALTDFNWDKAYVFTPYTPVDQISETLGEEWNHSTAISYLDTINLIIFMEDGEVVKYVELSRLYGDFSQDVVREGFTPDEAIVTVIPTR